MILPPHITENMLLFTMSCLKNIYRSVPQRQSPKERTPLLFGEFSVFSTPGRHKNGPDHERYDLAKLFHFIIYPILMKRKALKSSDHTDEVLVHLDAAGDDVQGGDIVHRVRYCIWQILQKLQLNVSKRYGKVKA